MIRDGDLSLSVDDNVADWRAHDHDLCKPRVDVSAVGKDDGCRAFPQRRKRSRRSFATRPTRCAWIQGPSRRRTRPRRRRKPETTAATRGCATWQTPCSAKAECERQLEEPAAAVRERHRLVEEHIKELNQREQALKDERSSHQSVQATTAVATNAKQPIQSHAARRGGRARGGSDARDAGCVEAALQTERRQLKDARKERDQFKQQSVTLQRNQQRNAATYNTSVGTLSERIAELETQVALSKDGRRADAAEHAKTVKQLTFSAQESAEWRRMSDERSELTVAALTQRAEEAEGLLRGAGRAAKRPESATAEIRRRSHRPRRRRLAWKGWRWRQHAHVHAVRARRRQKAARTASDADAVTNGGSSGVDGGRIPCSGRGRGGRGRAYGRVGRRGRAGRGQCRFTRGRHHHHDRRLRRRRRDCTCGTHFANAAAGHAPSAGSVAARVAAARGALHAAQRAVQRSAPAGRSVSGVLAATRHDVGLAASAHEHLRRGVRGADGPADAGQRCVPFGRGSPRLRCDGRCLGAGDVHAAPASISRR